VIACEYDVEPYIAWNYRFMFVTACIILISIVLGVMSCEI